MKKESKNYYKDIDLIRVFACLAILLYHLNILKGGYLAVCTFFVLSGYLSCISAFRKEKFSLWNYYSNRLLKIYLPLLIVVLITIAVISIFPNIIWLNLKPETTSVLLGFNNFWQLGANLDYFARHISSPFMHLWYIAILLQFDLVFPFIYLILRKIGDKIHKSIPCIITALLSIIGVIYFYKSSFTQNIMITYYDTFTRVFSLFFGLTLGFIHSYYDSSILNAPKNKVINRIIFYCYLLLLLFLFIFVNAKSIYFSSAMVIASLITCRLIEYGVNIPTDKLSIFNQFIKCCSDMSYEIYLLQYPIIFFFQYYITTNQFVKIPLIIALILVLSYLLHFCLDRKKKNKNAQIVKYILCVLLTCGVIYGGYQYYVAIDHTEEMKQLQKQMNQNAELMKKKQMEYASQIKKEQEVWNSTFESLQINEQELKKLITNFPIVGIGDSVMLGAIHNLYEAFPNGYFDAKTSRTPWIVASLLQDLKNRDMLGNPIVINLGTNGDCSESCKKEIIEICEDREIFWVNVTNDRNVHINDNLLTFASKYNNLHIIDWNSIASIHPEYLYLDGIHLTDIGRIAYTDTIYGTIYQTYYEKTKANNEQIIKDHEAQLKTKISFYGNDLLLNAFEKIQSDFSTANFIIDKDFTFESLQSEIEKASINNSLTYKLVFAFDSTINLGFKEYQSLLELCPNHQVHILTMNPQITQELAKLTNENITIIDNKELLDKKYYLADNIHLNEKGNKMLQEILRNNIQEKEMSNEKTNS